MIRQKGKGEGVGAKMAPSFGASDRGQSERDLHARSVGVAVNFHLRPTQDTRR